MSAERMTDEELAREAQRWDSRAATPKDWQTRPRRRRALESPWLSASGCRSNSSIS